MSFRVCGKCDFEWNVIEVDPSNISMIKNLCSKFDIVIDVNITLDNVERILENIDPLGIEIQSGDEIKTGIRSFEGIADLMELLEKEY